MAPFNLAHPVENIGGQACTLYRRIQLLRTLNELQGPLNIYNILYTITAYKFNFVNKANREIEIRTHRVRKKYAPVNSAITATNLHRIESNGILHTHIVASISNNTVQLCCALWLLICPILNKTTLS